MRRLKGSAFCFRVVQFFALFLLLFLAGEFGQARAAISLVQHTSKDAGSTTASTLAFPSANTAGNFIAVCIRGGLSSSQVFTVTDSNGNTYKQGGQRGFTISAVTLATYYAENIKGGANTVSVSMTVSGPLRFTILEYSGVATANSFDGASSATNQGTAVNSGNVTTTANGDLLLGTAATADPGTWTVGTGYTLRDSVPAPPNTKLITEDQIQGAAGTAAATATLAASGNWGAILAAFKPAGGGGGAGVPATIAATAGTPQSATVNTAFTTQLQATVKDSFNNPVSGVTVTFAAPTSGASGTFTGGVTTATTNASGVATAAVFTANTTAGGPYNVSASVSGVGTAANFALTNLAGTAASITATAGTPQSATVNTAFATQLQATVKDSFGNPVSGVTVTFNAPTSGASGTFAGGVKTATTSASGVATAAVFTANTTAGAYVLTASISGVSTPANFSLTNLAGAAASISATAGTPQSATINTAFTTQLQATVRDSFSNPVSGVTVTFTAPGSGASGTFAGGVNTAVTNLSGVATAAVFTANATVGGPYTVTASPPGVGTAANFSLTNLGNPPANIAATAGTPQSATINTAFAVQLQVTVTDSGNNPVPNATVTFTAPGSGASGTFVGGVNTAVTNASGVATAAVFTANSTAGSYTVTATVSGVSTPANFSLTNLTGPAATIAATAGTPQSATINTAYATQFQATVKDSGSNPVSGVTVTFTAPGSGASGTFVGGVNTAVTNASGVATAAVFTANSTAGSYTVTATVSGVSTPANFSLTNLSPPPPSITSLSPTSAPVGNAVTIAGANFGASQGTSTVTFNGTPATPTSWSATSIAVLVPNGATSGNVVVTVGGVASNGVVFTVVPTPNIASISPSGAQVGASVTITGTNFGASQGSSTVTFNVTRATPTSWSPTSITVPVPSGASTGNVLIVVNGVPSNVVPFTVVPTIVSLSTNSGVAGTAITIGGSNFGSFVAGDTVTFNGTLAQTGIWTDTSINVTVPSGATTGPVVVTVGGFPSNGVNFTVTPITITSLTPTSGPVGTSVTITGSNFGPAQGTSNVTFSGVTAAVTSWGQTSIVVSVPAGFTGTNVVVVNVGGVTSNSANFNIPAPTITSLNPTSGLFGTSVTITGTSFGSGQLSSTVSLNGAPLGITSWSDTSIVAFIPNGATTGPVVVTTSSGASNGITFTVIPPPNIGSLNPASGPAGTVVTVSGTSFGATQGTSKITFNGTVASPTGWSDTSITVPVPAGSTTGAVVVTRSGVASNGVNFTVTPPPPSITSLSPSAGAVGALILISGTNFGSSQGTSTVTFSGTSAGSIAPTAWSSVSITVQVPAGATTGNVVVTVSGVASNGVLFTVTPPPSITSLSPTSGSVGTSVTIAGSNFGATQGTSAVLFNGTTASVANWSNTSITATVPTGATTGNVVVDASGVNSNGVTFTVTVAAANIALVQHTRLDLTSTTSGSVAFARPNTAGNWIAVCIRGGFSSSQVFTITDSNGNTYQQAAQSGFPTSAVTLAVYYAENIKGGANTVSVTMNVSGPLRIAILEYSGVATSNSLNAKVAATGTSASPNSGNLTTTANGDLLLGAIAAQNTEVFTAGSGYTIEEFVSPAPGTKLIAADQIQTTAGSASVSASLSSSDNWGAILAAFKPAGGGGGAVVPATIAATAGTPQSATVNTAFALQLQATVKDSLNNPVSGVTVTFAAPGSGASGSFAGGVTTATTNASGVATAAVFTANTTGGAYIVTASVSGVSTTANFSLTNLAGAPSSITATAGASQSATINTAFATQLQATVKDSFNNPVSAVTVTFTAPSSGASGTFAGGVNTATTNAQGVATAPVFTANGTTGGPYTVAASVSGVVATANFSLTNLAAPPASVTATAGTPQSATVSTSFITAFQVTVKDASNNPVSGVAVTFTAPSSGASGTFAGGVNTATTNASGIATAAVFTANATAGAYTVTASVSGVSTPANFSLTNLAGAAASITATAGTPQSAVINSAFGTQLQAKVIDSLNNPVSGATVTFTAPSSGASGTFAGGVNTVTTNTKGVATAPVFTANATVGGPYTVTASVSGVSTSATFSLTNLSVSSNIALVQHRNIDASTASNNSLAFANNTTAGNFIAVCIRGSGSSSQVFTVSDSSGNTYRQAFRVGLSASLETFAIYYAENINGGPDTVSVAQSVLGTLRFIILEYSGVAASNSLDTTATAQGSSSAPNTGNLTTTANGDLLLATIITKNSQAFTAGSGYTIEESVQASPNTKIVAEDQLQSTAGTASASVSLSGSDVWGAGLAAFRSISGTMAPISVSVSPTTASVPAGYGTQSVTATVTNDFLNRGATWSLSGAGCSGGTCGTLTRVTTSSVIFNAPLNVPNPATVTLTATSIGDNTRSASVTITVTQGVLTVVVSPKRAAVTLAASQTVQFTGNVYNDPQNLGVTWQVDGNNGGNSTTGTISTTGLFTPGTQPGQHTVTAVSNANASVTGSALIAVTDLLGIYTHHNDNARTGQNLQEYGLTPATVTPATFGQLFSCPVDGVVFAQPLWVANLTVGGVAHNVVFITTEHNSVYAFDADSTSCVQLWQTNFLASGVTTLTPSDVNGNTDIIPEIGITSTPVIDPSTNTLYAVAKTRETVGTVSGQACSTGTPCYVHRLHALDLTTGGEKFGGPVVITATNFVPQRHLQRPALLLANSTLYIAFGSHGDQCNYQGWLMGYNPSTLGQIFATALSNPSSGCNQGAVWHPSGPSADASGNVYVVTGNGLYDGTLNFGDTAVKLNSTGSFPPADWFTPFNQATLAANDVDLGSAGVLILPDAVGSAAHPHLALLTGKTAILYLLDQTNMGKFNSSTNNDVQEVIPVPPTNTTLDDGGNYGMPAYWNGNIYSTGQNYPLSQFQISNGAISIPQFAKSPNTFPPRGGVPSVSANGTAGGIVWIIDYTGFQDNTPAILDAYDATNVGTLLYSSPASGAGSAGIAVKFTTPTVANGKVYIGTQFAFNVYGLLPN